MNTSLAQEGLVAGAPSFSTQHSVSDRGGHAVCWGAIFAGAAGAASLSLILLILGIGLGLSSVSPWASEGVKAETFGASTVVWLTITQLAAAAMGGYLAGRLRTRWIDVQADEVYFRDTAHGFLAWSLATLVTAGMLTGAIGSIVGGAAKTGAAVAGTAATASAAAATPGVASATNATSASGAGPDYFVDALFRKDMASTPNAGAIGTTNPVPDTSRTDAPSSEAARIFINAAATGTLPADDGRYLGQLVAQRTGLSQDEAEKRVSDVFGRMQAKLGLAKDEAKAAADKARKVSAAASLWGFVSLLIGAFIASWVATLGGRHRDIP